MGAISCLCGTQKVTKLLLDFGGNLLINLRPENTIEAFMELRISGESLAQSGMAEEFICLQKYLPLLYMLYSKMSYNGQI